MTGVEVEDDVTGRRYRITAPTVVGCRGPQHVRPAGGSAAEPEWQQELAKLPAEPAAISLFLGLGKSPTGFGVRGENHWFMPDLDGREGCGSPPNA